MRVIAGTARRLLLKTVEGMDTRPTSDQIKETLFNMLQYDIPGCYFLDLFAGSGQMGLESLSRGGEYAIFVENNRKAAKCIEENINFTKFDKVSRLVVSDVVTALYTLEGKYKFDIVFIYKLTDLLVVGIIIISLRKLRRMHYGNRSTPQSSSEVSGDEGSREYMDDSRRKRTINGVCEINTREVSAEVSLAVN